jgi:hypothetical protein
MQSPHIRCTSATPSRPQEIRSFEGFYVPWEKQLLFYALGVLSFGLVFLLAKWSPKVHIALNLRRCPLKEATFVRITVSSPRPKNRQRRPRLASDVLPAQCCKPAPV